MSEFATPLAIFIEDESHLDLVYNELEKLGYKIDRLYNSYKHYNYIATDFNRGETCARVLNHAPFSRTRTKVSSNNLELIKALAAMRNGDEFYVGEWIYRIEMRDIKKIVGFEKYASTLDGLKLEGEKEGDTFNPLPQFVRKATKNEIIEHFEKSKSMEIEIETGKEIVGYFAKEQYRNVAELVGKGGAFNDNNGFHFRIHSLVYDKLKKAGVLDLWCEPVYKAKELKLTLEGTNKSVEITFKREGYFEADNFEVPIHLILKPIEGRILESGYINNNGLSIQSAWTIIPETISIGCLKGVKVSDLYYMKEKHDEFFNKDLPF